MIQKAFAALRAAFGGKEQTPTDPELDALRAEYAKPLRERRHLRAIEKQMQSIINARLAGGR